MSSARELVLERDLVAPLLSPWLVPRDVMSLSETSQACLREVRAGLPEINLCRHRGPRQLQTAVESHDTSRGKAPGNGLSKKLIYPNQSHAIGVGGTHEAPTPPPRRIEGYNCMLSYASAAGCWLTARAVVNMPNTRNGCAVP